MPGTESFLPVVDAPISSRAKSVGGRNGGWPGDGRDAARRQQGRYLAYPVVVNATDRIGRPNSRTREAQENEPRPPAKYGATSAKDQARGHSARYRRDLANRRPRL